jgi:hypothetical protein
MSNEGCLGNVLRQRLKTIAICEGGEVILVMHFGPGIFDFDGSSIFRPVEYPQGY